MSVTSSLRADVFTANCLSLPRDIFSATFESQRDIILEYFQNTAQINSDSHFNNSEKIVVKTSNLDFTGRRWYFVQVWLSSFQASDTQNFYYLTIWQREMVMLIQTATKSRDPGRSQQVLRSMQCLRVSVYNCCSVFTTLHHRTVPSWPEE